MSGASVNRRAQVSAGRHYYVWEIQEKRFCVLLNLDVVQRISEMLEREIGPVSERATELGGVLLGSAKETETGWQITIDGFEAIPFEHPRGIAYALAGSDRRKLQQKLESRPVAGFFRAHARPGLFLDQDDFRLAQTFFPGPASVFLIVKRDSGGMSRGGFFFWEEGDIQRRSSYLPFPFDRTWLESGKYQIREVAPTVAPPVRPPRQIASKANRLPAFTLPKVNWPKAALFKPVALTAFVAVSVFALLMTVAWFLSGERNATPRQSDIGLSATRNGENFRVTWNRNHPRVEEAARGVLWITDGRKEHRIDLDARQLKMGSVIYHPATNDVNFQLDILSEAPVSESVRAIAGGAGSAGTPDAAGAVASMPPGTVVEETTRSTPPVQPPGVSKQSRKEVRRLEPPPGIMDGADRARTSRSNTPLDPPPMLAVNMGRQLNRVQAPALDQPREAPPVVTVTMEPVEPSVVRRFLQKIPGIRELQRNAYRGGEEFEPAVPLKRPSPTLPPSLYSTIHSTVPIDLRVSIDEQGRVFQTRLVTEEPLPPSLVRLAEDTAAKWSFRPARIKDKEVDSEVVLQFRFSPALVSSR
ncbi:MAG: energy transducer TonB [Bryobacterales bacterium]|nr:energy transducer TonB [Bryobacterales bacterium]